MGLEVFWWKRRRCLLRVRPLRRLHSLGQDPWRRCRQAVLRAGQMRRRRFRQVRQAAARTFQVERRRLRLGGGGGGRRPLQLLFQRQGRRWLGRSRLGAWHHAVGLAQVLTGNEGCCARRELVDSGGSMRPGRGTQTEAGWRSARCGWFRCNRNGRCGGVRGRRRRSVVLGSRDHRMRCGGRWCHSGLHRDSRWLQRSQCNARLRGDPGHHL